MGGISSASMMCLTTAADKFKSEREERGCSASPRMMGGTIVASEKLGFSRSKKSQAARSAKVLLATVRARDGQHNETLAIRWRDAQYTLQVRPGQRKTRLGLEGKLAHRRNRLLGSLLPRKGRPDSAGTDEARIKSLSRILRSRERRGDNHALDARLALRRLED